MLKRHELEILLKAGHPKTEVARLAGVSLCSVKRIRAILSILALAKGARTHARFLLEYSEDEVAVAIRTSSPCCIDDGCKIALFRRFAAQMV